MSSVEFINVGKSYGTTEIIKNINFKTKANEFISFLGPSGCGKTTCLRMIAGLEKNTKGIIKINDEIMSNSAEKQFIPPEKRNLGMVFQSYAIWPHMNVYKNVSFPLEINKINKSEIEERVHKVLKLVELDNLEKRMPDALSGGQQQRVALARGLVMEPSVLLLDEPLSNLDAKLREKMRYDIRKIQQDLKITCLYVTHDQIEAFTMSDTIFILNKGDILQTGSPSEIRNNPNCDFVRDFIKKSH